jgi:hypothetical protein
MNRYRADWRFRVHMRRISATLLVGRVRVHRMWQKHLTRLGWLGFLTAVLVTAGVILTAAKKYLGGGALIAVALVVATQLLPRLIEWYKGQRTQDQEGPFLLP